MDQKPSASSALERTSPEGIGRPVALALIGLGLGLAVEVLFYGHPPGVSVPLWTGSCLAAAFLAARLEGQTPSASARWLAIPALALSFVVMLRQEPVTVALSLFLTLLTLALVVRLFLFGRFLRLGWIDTALAFVWVPVEAWIRPWSVAGEAWSRTVQERGGRRVVFSILRGLLLALPFLVAFVALLSAADLVFGDYVARILRWIDLARLADWAGRATVVVGSGLFLLGAVVAALRPPGDRRLIGEDPPLIRPFLGFTELSIVLTLVLALFVSFVGIQFTYLFGGEANIHAAGYTYSDYARRGFGELLAVAFLALGMIYALASVGRMESAGRRRIFFGLCAALVLMVGVMLASAYQRLVLYELAYGFSRLRTHTHAAIGWLAAMFVLFLALLLARRLRALAPASLLAASGFTLTLAILNVDGFIVAQNGARYAASGDLDAAYLATLTHDAVPALVRLAAQAEGEEQLRLLADLSCRRRSLRRNEEDLAWPSTHLARSRALESMAGINGLLDGYPVYLRYRGYTQRLWSEYVVKIDGEFVPCRSTLD